MCMISVIVPVYNSETYLPVCLQSLMGQTLREMEFIIIDDGSTDRSGEIMEEFARQDGRFRVIHQENKGLGNARNVGLEMACGKYIAFVDSDDWVIYKAYERLLAVAEKFQVEILQADLVYAFEGGRRINPFKRKDQTPFHDVLSGKDCFIQLNEAHVFNPMVVVYLYRRDFIEQHSFRFAPILHEDVLWSLIAMCLADRVKVFDFQFYAYRQHSASITHAKCYSSERSASLFYVADKLYAFMQQNYTYEKDRNLIFWLYDRIIWIYRYEQNLHESNK